MSLSYILEKRSNPDINTKVDRWDTFQAFYKKYGSKLFVSFTSIDKLGINIQSEFKTPLGIYSYRADYVNDMGAFDKLPYAADPEDTKFINYFSIKPGFNVINVIAITEQQAKAYIEICRKWYLLKVGLNPDSKLQDSQLDQEKYDQVTKILDITESEAYFKYKNKWGPAFWYFTWKVTKYAPGDNATLWNVLFRKYLGIDGVVDPGTGTIHPNEPDQAVFFSLPCINVISRELNKVAPKADIVKAQNDLRDKYRHATADVLIKNINDYKLFTNPHIIVQKAAIDAGLGIDTIKNPSKEIFDYYQKKLDQWKF